MIYRLPQISDQAILLEYVQEHHAHGETSISASMGLAASTHPDWVKKIRCNALHGDAYWGKSLLYLCLDQNRLVGLLSIRYELPEALTKSLGDIGYGVRPSERCKGYATQMLRHALSVCKGKGKQQIILGCYRDNAASAKVICRCGGVLLEENDHYHQGVTSQYYLIDL